MRLPTLTLLIVSLCLAPASSQAVAQSGQGQAPAQAVPGQQPGAVPQPDQPAQPKATVRGRVYALDTGAPLKRAQVMLRQEGRRGMVFGPASMGGGPTEPMIVATDAQGGFEFRNVEAGTYNLSVTKSGYIPTTYGQKAPNQPGIAVTVSPGQELKDFDFRLVRGGVITGTVVDEDGEPLPNVQVQVLARQYTRGQVRYFPQRGASTDDRGAYRIFGLSPGRYYVQAQWRSWWGGEQAEGMPSYAPVYYPSVLSLKDAQRIEVTSGAEVARVDFRLGPVPAYSVAGRVVDGTNGQPVSGAFINVMGADTTNMMARYDGSRARPDGSFQVRGLLPGRYRLMVMVPERRGPGRNGGMMGQMRPVAKLFDLGAANINDMVVVVGPGVAVRGRVVAEGGSLSAESTRVNLVPRAEAGFGMPGGGTTQLKEDLTFELEGVQPGDYDVNVFATGGGDRGQSTQGSFYVKEVRAGGQDVAERGLSVAEAAPVLELVVVVDFQPGNVAGRLVNESGDPVTGSVALVAADITRRGNDRYFRTGRTDQSGNFTVRSVVPGDYLLVAWPDQASQLQDPELFSQVEKFATRVRVERGASVTQEARLTPEIRTVAVNVAQ